MTKAAGGEWRVAELDAVRGLAALAVLFFHLPLGFWFGATGVDCFFVLSGYLITSIILKNYRKDRFLRNFYARRSLRIWPIYYLALGVIVLVNSLRGRPGSVAGLPYYLVYLQNIQHYWRGTVPGFDVPARHMWTLAIEEQFYLLWPFVIVLFGRKGLVPAALTFILLPLVLRGCDLSSKMLFTHSEALGLGGLLAYLFAENRDPSIRKNGFYLTCWLVPLALHLWLCCSLMARGYTWKQAIESNAAIFLIALSYFGLIDVVVLNAGKPWLKVLRLPALCYIGSISYGLYLYHWIIYEYLDTVFKFGLKCGDPWWLDVLKVVVSVGIAFLSWRFLEQPILALKGRFSYGGGRAASPAAGRSTGQDRAGPETVGPEVPICPAQAGA